ncbi:hypothetical protein KSP39_PZI002550 [Platanthera zijinensis]|uniref:CCHC-type domain-containing protein n=1 Tax=Platanthera zijinensis TaxID=2320716 RepID=A0AAP0GE53_9ASPA
MNRSACGLIRNCLTQEIKYRVMLETCAGNLWSTLENKYLTKNMENRLYMKRRLYRFQMRHGVSIDEHLSEFTKLLADLLNLDEDVGDENKTLLLNSLPDEYENFTMSLIHGKEVLKYSEVSTTLLKHKFRRRDKELSKTESAEALVSHRGRYEKKNWHKKTNNSTQKHGNSRGRSLERNQCEFCLETGHWKKDCPKLKEKNKRLSSEAKAILLRRLLVVSLDTGAVSMDNDKTCRTIGVESILVRMHDGAVRELTEVRHVPDIRKNLLSVGALEAKGYKIVIEEGVLKISRGALVFMRGVRHHNLYYLQGNTVTGTVAVADDSLDANILWHMRLAHGGEASLQALSRQGLIKGAKNCKLDFCEH